MCNGDVILKTLQVGSAESLSLSPWWHMISPQVNSCPPAPRCCLTFYCLLQETKATIIALVIYCYITNYHQLTGLQQYMSYLHFCGKVIWAWPRWALFFRVSHKAAIKVSARATVPSEGSTGEGSALKLMWLSAEFSFWKVLGLRPSVPHCLLVRGLPQLLATWAFPTGQLASSQYTSWEDSRVW